MPRSHRDPQQARYHASLIIKYRFAVACHTMSMSRFHKRMALGGGSLAITSGLPRYEQTVSVSVGMSQRCQFRTRRERRAKLGMSHIFWCRIESRAKAEIRLNLGPVVGTTVPRPELAIGFAEPLKAPQAAPFGYPNNQLAHFECDGDDGSCQLSLGNHTPACGYSAVR